MNVKELKSEIEKGKKYRVTFCQAKANFRHTTVMKISFSDWDKSIVFQKESVYDENNFHLKYIRIKEITSMAGIIIIDYVLGVQIYIEVVR